MADKHSILLHAIQLAEHTGWEAMSLHQLAEQQQLTLADIHQHFTQKDDIVDAWFDLADSRTLSLYPQSKPPQLAWQRIEQVILNWLHMLAGHRQLSGQMLLYKLEPGHLHLQLAGVLRISRTVQWFMHAANISGGPLQRIAQEIYLSSIFVSTFIYWLNDNSPTQQRSKSMLKQALLQGHRRDLWQ